MVYLLLFARSKIFAGYYRHLVWEYYSFDLVLRAEMRKHSRVHARTKTGCTTSFSKPSYWSESHRFTDDQAQNGKGMHGMYFRRCDKNLAFFRDSWVFSPFTRLVFSFLGCLWSRDSSSLLPPSKSEAGAAFPKVAGYSF